VLLWIVPRVWRWSEYTKHVMLDRRREKMRAAAVSLSGYDLERQRNLEIAGDILVHRNGIRLGSNLASCLISVTVAGWFAGSLDRLISPEWWANWLAPVICFVAFSTLLFAVPRVWKLSHCSRTIVLNLRMEMGRLEAVPLSPSGMDRERGLQIAREAYSYRKCVHWGVNLPIYIVSVVAAGFIPPALISTVPQS
jgi:hypothetical protein